MQTITMISAVLLAIAISIDSLLASFSYGSQKISIPVRSLLVIALICSGVLGASLLVGDILAAALSETVTTVLSFTILAGLGLIRVFDSLVKHWVRKQEANGREITFSAFRLNFILRIWADPDAADLDGSRTLSMHEASFLAIALSLDGIAAGFGAGLMGTYVFFTTTLTFLFTALAIFTGCKLGKRLANVIRRDISWVSGLILILLAFFQL